MELVDMINVSVRIELKEIMEELDRMELKYMKKIEGYEKYIPLMKVMLKEVIFAENKYYWLEEFENILDGAGSIEEEKEIKDCIIDILETREYIGENLDKERLKVYKLIDLAKSEFVKNSSLKRLNEYLFIMKIMRDRVPTMVEGISTALLERYSSFIALTSINIIKGKLRSNFRDMKVIETSTIYNRKAYVIKTERENCKKTMFYRPETLELTIVNEHKLKSGKIARSLRFDI